MRAISSPWLGAYLPRHCWMHALDARAKLAALILLSVATFAASDALGLGVLVAVAFVCILSCHVPLGALARALRPTLLLFALVLLANGLVLDGSQGIQVVGPLGISAGGVVRGVRAVVRIVLLVSLVVLVTSTTTVPQLTRALAFLMRPLARLGLPVEVLALVVSVTLRLIPEVMGQFDGIVLAQRARGAKFDEGGPLRRLRAYTAVMVPLVMVLLRRSEVLADALRDRAFTVGTPLATASKLASCDYALLVTALALLALAICL